MTEFDIHNDEYSLGVASSLLPPGGLPGEGVYRAPIDDEPDYPSNYGSSASSDEFSSSMLSDDTRSGHYAHHGVDGVNEKEPVANQLVEQNEKRLLDGHSSAATVTVGGSSVSHEESGVTAPSEVVGTCDSQYVALKSKYLRSAGVAIPGVDSKRPFRFDTSFASPPTLSPSAESAEKRQYDTLPSPLSLSATVAVSASGSAGSAVAPTGLLSRLLSERRSSPASTPKVASHHMMDSKSHSPSSSLTGSPSLVPSSSSSSVVPVLSRRTSPVLIPKRVEAPCDGVRYRKAKPVTHDDIEEEEYERRRLADIKMASQSSVGHHRRSSSSKVSGDFTFSDVFDVPLATAATSSRPVTIPSGRVARVVSVKTESGLTPSTRVKQLPSSALDGFLYDF